MILTDNTIGVLNNYAKINPNILIRPGNVIRTVSANKSVMSKALVDNDFDTTVSIYDLKRFLNTLSLFEKPDVDFKNTHLTIEAGSSKVRYSYAAPELLTVAKDKDLNVQDFIDTVHISKEVLEAVDRVRKTLGLLEIAIEADGEKLWIKAVDASGSTDDEFSIELGESDRTFRAVIKSENLELIPQSYDVSISSKGITYWKGNNIEYWIVLVANRSEFND